MGEQAGLPACLMARFVIKSFLHENPQFLLVNNTTNVNGANGKIYLILAALFITLSHYVHRII